jgi:hypothetical protein
MREQLLHWLAEAAEIEHNLLCNYLYAAFSLRRPGEGLSDAEAAAVQRWRKLVSGIAVQEMGHFATVNNLIVALGGRAHLDRPNFPVPAGYHPSGFRLRLTPFDEATLEHFIYLERPGDAPLADARGFEHPRTTRDDRRDWITPSGRDYGTIGELYAGIRQGLKILAAERGAEAFVRGAPQLAGGDVGLEGVVVISDLASALAALQLIVEQGEGAEAHSSDSHFARFRSVQEEWARLKAANPAFVPSHAAAADPVMRKPADPQGHTWITAPEARETLDLGNALYGTLLTLLAQLYEPLSPDERGRIAHAAIQVMHGVGALGERLARLEAGLSFAMPRSPGPRASARLILERLRELAPYYGRAMPEGPNPVEEAARVLERSKG